MELNLSGNLGGQIDEMLQGSIVGNISLIEPQPEPPVLETLNVTENRTYTPPSGVDGYDEVIVDVPIPEPVLETLSATENRTYTPPSGVDGYDEVIVDVPIPTPTFETLNVTENGTYTPSSDVDGYDEVIVNVPSVNSYLNNKLVATTNDYMSSPWDSVPNNNTKLLFIMNDNGRLYATTLTMSNTSQTVTMTGTTFQITFSPSGIGLSYYGGSYRNIRACVIESDSTNTPT